MTKKSESSSHCYQHATMKSKLVHYPEDFKLYGQFDDDKDFDDTEYKPIKTRAKVTRTPIMTQQPDANIIISHDGTLIDMCLNVIIKNKQLTRIYAKLAKDYVLIQPIHHHSYTEDVLVA